MKKHRRAPLILTALLASTAAHAVCQMTIDELRAHKTKSATIAPMSRKAFFFLEGVWSMNPVTPPGLPSRAASAFLLRLTGQDGGDVVFADDKGCLVATRMPAPKVLIDLINEIDHGPGEDL